MRPRFLARISVTCFFFITLAPAEAGRVKVALLDGEPVYHWTTFPSARQNDVDRALILRDFQRQGFHLPEHFVDEAIQRTIDKEFGGDRAKLNEGLKQRNEIMDDYRKYTAEEVILEAMRVRMTQRPQNGKPPVTEGEWLKSLRKGARIQMIKSDQMKDR